MQGFVSCVVLRLVQALFVILYRRCHFRTRFTSCPVLASYCQRLLQLFKAFLRLVVYLYSALRWHVATLCVFLSWRLASWYSSLYSKSTDAGMEAVATPAHLIRVCLALIYRMLDNMFLVVPRAYQLLSTFSFNVAFLQVAKPSLMEWVVNFEPGSWQRSSARPALGNPLSWTSSLDTCEYQRRKITQRSACWCLEGVGCYPNSLHYFLELFDCLLRRWAV